MCLYFSVTKIFYYWWVSTTWSNYPSSLASANCCWVRPSLSRCCALLSPNNWLAFVRTNAHHTSCLILNGAVPLYPSIISLRLTLSPSTVHYPLAQFNKQKTNRFALFLTQFPSGLSSLPLPPLPAPKIEYNFLGERQRFCFPILKIELLLTWSNPCARRRGSS